MKISKLKIGLLAFLVSFSVLCYVLPRQSSAQFFGATNPSTPEEQQRCKGFWSAFEVSPSYINQNRDKQFEGNVSAGTPQICTAQQALVIVMYIAFALAGSAAVLFIIVGGFQYLTSSGNDELAEKGRKTLTTAIIGLVVILLSVMIVRIVTNALGGNLNGGSSSSDSQDLGDEDPAGKGNGKLQIGDTCSGDSALCVSGYCAPSGRCEAAQPAAPTVQRVIQLTGLPNEIGRSEVITINALVFRDDLPLFDQVCPTSIDQTAITVTYEDANGQVGLLGAPRFSRAVNDQYPWKIQISGASFPSTFTQGTLVLTVCGKTLASQGFTVK